MELNQLIQAALDEDLPDGDLTTDSLGLESRPGRARLVAKQDLVLSGADIFRAVLHRLDPEIQVRWHFADGDAVLSGQVLCSVGGDLLAVIKAERTALNFVGRLSGIATLTRRFVKAVEGTNCQILDTRKTTPGFRLLEKRAVKDGGATNHRLNLSEAILLKENHLRLAGGITAAIREVRQRTDLPIEIEVTNLEEVQEALAANAQRLLLDNMSDDEIRATIELVPSHVRTEASGNMTLERVGRVARLGVDFISVGALTHSAPCADISLLFDWETPL